MTTFLQTANKHLSLPAAVYTVKGNLVEVRRPKRKPGDSLKPVSVGHPLTPHWGQKPVWYDRKTRNQILLAGSQGGKSHIGPYWMWREIERKLEDKRPGQEYLFGIVAPTLQMQRQRTVGMARMARFLEQKFRCSEDVFLNKQDLRIDLRPLGYPVHIYAGSAERRHRLQGARLEAAWIDEGANVRDSGIYHITTQRLHGEGRLLVTTTPYLAGAQWLKQIIDKVADGKDLDTVVVRFPSIVNPYFSLEEEAALKKSLPSWYFNMMYNAQFERPQGLVYPNVTYIEPFAIPRHWVRIIGVDPTYGGSDEFAAVWIAYDPFEPETWYIYREFYLSCQPRLDAPDQPWRSPHEMLDAIHSMSVVEDYNGREFTPTGERENISRIFSDTPDVVMYLQDRFPDSSVYQADKRMEGLFEVGSLLKTGQLLVFNNLINWQFEQTNYIYDIGEFGEAITKNRGKPLDRNNHLMDATRYAVCQSDEARNLAEPSFG